MYVCGCGCTCVYVSVHVCVCVCVYVYVHVCVCASVCMLYILCSMSACVCVCVLSVQVHSNPVLSSQSPYSVQSEPSVLLVRPNTSSSVSFVVTANDSNVGGPPSEALQGTLTALDLDRSGVSLAYNSSGRGQLAFYLFFLVYVACQHSLPSLLLLANHMFATHHFFLTHHLFLTHLFVLPPLTPACCNLYMSFTCHSLQLPLSPDVRSYLP